MALDLTKQNLNTPSVANFVNRGFTQSADPANFLPTLSTPYPKTTAGKVNNPIVTSQPAKDHVNTMGTNIMQVNKDIANNSQYNTNAKANMQMQEEAKKQQAIENSKDNPLLSLLGEDSTQQDVISSNQQQNKIDRNYLKQVSDAMDQISSGTFPLSANERAQLDSIKGSATQAIEQATTLMEQKQMGQTKLNARTGLQMYSPSEAISNITKRAEEGQQKISEINATLLENQQKLTQAFQDKNFKQATTLYNRISDTIKERNDEIKSINDDIKAKRKELFDYMKYEQEQADKERNELDKGKNEILTQIGKSGNKVPPEVLKSIQNASTVGEAMAMAGDYMYSQNDRIDAIYKQAQIDKIYSDIQKDQTEQGQNPDELMAYAQEYAANGKIPTGLPKGKFGKIAEIAKEIPKTPGQILSSSTGVAPTGGETLQNGIGALYSAIELAKQLQELDKKRWDGLLSGSVGKVFGAEDQQNYIDLRSQIVDLLARARSGAALTPSEEARYSEMLPGRFSTPLGLGADPQVKIRNFINALSSDSKNKASVQGWVINGLSTVKIGNEDYTVGDVITNSQGQSGRVNADGSITLI